MCGGFPSSTTKGEPAPKMSIWQAIVEAWRELRGGRWYDAHTRPQLDAPTSELPSQHGHTAQEG